MVAEVVTTLVVSLVLGLAQIVMPEESEHKRDLLLAWIRHRECRAKVQVPQPERRTSRTGSVGDPRDRTRGFITAIVRQLRSRVSSLGRIGPHSRPRPERNSHGSPNAGSPGSCTHIGMPATTNGSSSTRSLWTPGRRAR